MAQYFPTNRTKKNILLNRAVRRSEFARVSELLDKYGLENGWVQEMESNDYYRPNFNEDREDPFGNKKLFEIINAETK
jgi:putative pyruvate formate lyase activating enzyme